MLAIILLHRYSRPLPTPHTRPWTHLLNILHSFDFILSLFLNLTLSSRPVNAITMKHLAFIFHSPYIYRVFTQCQELFRMLLHSLSYFHKTCEVEMSNLMLSIMKRSVSGIN